MLLVCKVLCGHPATAPIFRAFVPYSANVSVMSTLVITVCKPVTDDDSDPIQFKDHLKPLGQRARAARDPAEPGFFANGEHGSRARSRSSARWTSPTPVPGMSACGEASHRGFEVGGAGLEPLPARFGITKDSLHRHMQNHVSSERLKIFDFWRILGAWGYRG